MSHEYDPHLGLNKFLELHNVEIQKALSEKRESLLRIAYPGGGRMLEGLWNADAPTGTLKVWHRNGHLLFEAEFRGGKLDGLFRSWHSNGKAAEQGFYSEGAQMGTWLKWNSQGEMMGEEN